jgi:replicative DNA helicase Mcm
MVELFANSTFTLHHKAWDGYGMCYADDVEILSSEGWIRFADLKPEAKVATIRKGELIYEKPTARQSYRYVGEMLHFRGQGIDTLVTPDHRMYVATSRHIATGPGAERRAMHWGLLPASSGILAKLRRYSRSTSVQVLAAANEWRRLSPACTPGELARAEMLGWYISEGCVCRNRGVPRKVCIANTKRENLRRIASVLKRIGFTARIRPLKGNPLRVEVCNTVLAIELSKFGRSWEKYIPRFILDGPRPVQRAFLKAYLRGDGSHSRISRSTWVAGTVSQSLSADLQELCFKLGYRSSVKPRTYKHGKWRTLWKVSIDTRGNPRTRHLYYPPTRVQYDGMVYCVTVPSGLLVVRRNGHPVVCGNCAHQSYACGRPVICFESDYRGKMAGKLMQDMKTAVFISGDAEYTKKKLEAAIGHATAMQVAARRRFEEVVNFDEEEKEIRKWLSEI